MKCLPCSTNRSSYSALSNYHPHPYIILPPFPHYFFVQGAPSLPPFHADSTADAVVLPPPVGGGSPTGCKPLVYVTYVARLAKPFSPTPVQRRVIANPAEFIGALRAANPEVRGDTSVWGA